MFPEKRYFFETSTTEVAIHTNLLSDLYASIGTGSSITGWYTTIMKQPFLILIRIGFFFASLGGARCLLRKLKKEKLEFGSGMPGLMKSWLTVPSSRFTSLRLPMQ